MGNDVLPTVVTMPTCMHEEVECEREPHIVPAGLCLLHLANTGSGSRPSQHPKLEKGESSRWGQATIR